MQTRANVPSYGTATRGHPAGGPTATPPLAARSPTCTRTALCVRMQLAKSSACRHVLSQFLLHRHAGTCRCSAMPLVGRTVTGWTNLAPVDSASFTQTFAGFVQFFTVSCTLILRVSDQLLRMGTRILSSHLIQIESSEHVHSRRDHLHASIGPSDPFRTSAKRAA